MAESVIIIGLVGVLLLLQACIAVFVSKAIGNNLLRTIALLSLSILVVTYTVVEGRSSLARTNQTANILLLTLGWIFFYELVVLPIIFTFWCVYASVVRRRAEKGCRKCGLENGKGLLFCSNCRVFSPQCHPIALTIALFLLAVVLAKIGHMTFVLAFRNVVQ